MGVTTKRIDLAVSGGWAEVRRTNGADVIYLEEQAHARGYEATGTDAVLLAERVVEAWEASGFTAVRDLPEPDITRIYLVAKGVDDPNLLAPSSDGTKPARRREGSPRQNG